ncbi:hypothetical protein CHU95_01925 [Niveispirillum lacus]|uniref:HTH araC/xylS-type domain-containing protein n=1 Tax=Niveispirillum lacus TaxID=1981099 RepID=A0A255Z8R5_9PROT|nr:helix-turn-helix domain-containing protein [Niveispirillum lacus]OYQ37294.1 hypothetical protein CHU95_01925 [Niveispirillum lacus]
MQPFQIANAALSLLIAAQVIFMVPLLLARPERRTLSNRWLAALLGLFALNNILDIAGGLSSLGDHPAFIAINIWLVAPMGPLAFCHIVTALPGGRVEAPVRLWLPVLLMALLMVPWLFLSPASLETALSGGGASAWLVLLAGAGALVLLPSLILFLGACLWGAIRRVDAVKAAPNGAGAVHLAWLSLLSRGLLLMWAVLTLSLILTLFGGEQVVELAAGIAYLLATYGLSLLALGRADAFVPPREVGERVMALLTAPVAKYRKSALTETDITRLLAKADYAMQQDGLWRESGLTLPYLARHVGASVNDLSQALNEGRGINFFDFVNGFRVDAVKQALADPALQDRPVLDLALEAGFNSKSAFNAAFKKRTGQTPSAFRARA